ncbi:hypothetical protein F5888DRAFT_1631694 [Russula emetica]|nr:hypothetical protein F5888DRAFT_1631694 [Russula emetica]
MVDCLWIGAAFTRKSGGTLYVEAFSVFAHKYVPGKEVEEGGLSFWSLSLYAPGKETVWLHVPVCKPPSSFAIHYVSRLRVDAEAEAGREENDTYRCPATANLTQAHRARYKENTAEGWRRRCRSCAGPALRDHRLLQVEMALRDIVQTGSTVSMDVASAKFGGGGMGTRLVKDKAWSGMLDAICAFTPGDSVFGAWDGGLRALMHRLGLRAVPLGCFICTILGSQADNEIVVLEPCAARNLSDSAHRMPSF